MNATIEVFAQVRQAATLSEKISLLKNHRSDLVDLIAADAMDKSITYGITSKGIEIQPRTLDDHLYIGWYDGFHAILERLASRKLTGNAAIEDVTDYLKYHDEETQRFLLQVLDRDLSLGIGWDTYRSEVMGLDDQFEVALAQHLEKVKGVNPVDGQWFASRKCDGCVSGDTLVEIEGVGALPISEVVERKLRGKIRSMDPSTGEVVYSDIVDWMHNVPDTDSAHKDWFLLELADGRSLKITGNDSVYVKDRGWTRADSLKEGDELLTGTLYTSISKISRISPQDSYELTVDKTHCFFCNGILKHNCRCIAIIRDGEVEFRSRQNKVFTTLDRLKPAVANFCLGLTGQWVLDGELCKIDENGDEDFQSVMKEIRKKDYTIESCCYQVFDVLTYDEFRLGKTREDFTHRLALLKKLNEAYQKHPHGDCWVKPLKQERLTCQADFDRWAGYVEAGNWEGFMLRKDVPYQSGRTKDLLKVKKFSDLEAVVLDVVVGEMTTALPGKGNETFTGVRSLVISYKGNIVNVGSGLTREQRIEWYKDPSKIIGSDICVKYFEETVSQDGKCSLRFPTLKYAYSGKRDV